MCNNSFIIFSSHSCRSKESSLNLSSHEVLHSILVPAYYLYLHINHTLHIKKSLSSFKIILIRQANNIKINRTKCKANSKFMYYSASFIFSRHLEDKCNVTTHLNTLWITSLKI